MVGKAQKPHGARSEPYGGCFNGGSTDPLFPSRTQNGGTLKKRPSPHLHEIPTRGNKVSLRTSQTAVVHR
jgi:hypothetical protein